MTFNVRHLRCHLTHYLQECWCELAVVTSRLWRRAHRVLRQSMKIPAIARDTGARRCSEKEKVGLPDMMIFPAFG